MKNQILKSLTAAAFLFAASSSHASLIYKSAETFSGTGLGTVNTILTIQNKTQEAGSVSYNGTNDVITGNAKTGNSQTQTRTVSDLGLTDAASLRIVFNAAEPGGDSISLDNLVLNFYNSTGGVLFTSGLFTPVPFSSTLMGTGNSGFVFALDATQAAQAQSAVFALQSFGNIRVGLTASASSSDGGNETFYVANYANGGGGGNGQVPEPATVALIGLGLLGFAASRRKSAKASKA